MKHAELDLAPADVWQALAAHRGAWRTPVLANVASSGDADARVVVLREVSAEKREAVFFTDRRSNKHAALRARPSACLVVYDAEAGLQVRLYGEAREETAAPELEAWWEALGPRQRAHYGNGAETRKGRENFAAFRVTVDRFHCLWLHDEGNAAAEFRWNAGEWRGVNVRP
ncbi:MAG TPA: pyridoxamine 5'-phosphate oxidase family protein [Gammaproteobacteria bacterium]